MSNLKESKITLKGQIVIPKELRELLNINAGEKLVLKPVDKKILLLPKPKDPVSFLISVGKKVKLGNLREEIKKFRREER